MQQAGGASSEFVSSIAAVNNNSQFSLTSSHSEYGYVLNGNKRRYIKGGSFAAIGYKLPVDKLKQLIGRYKTQFNILVTTNGIDQKTRQLALLDGEDAVLLAEETLLEVQEFGKNAATDFSGYFFANVLAGRTHFESLITHNKGEIFILAPSIEICPVIAVYEVYPCHGRE